MAPETPRKSILEFLNSARSPKKRIVCPCGAVMEYQDTKFFYDGQSWEVVLPICRKCHPATPCFSHDA
jgi:hypothetical protein